MAHIIIISDTHTNSIKNLSEALVSAIKQADAVIHAGDADNTSFIEELQAISPKQFYAVAGNCDYDSNLQDKLVVDICGLRIGITHGTGRHETMINRLNYIFADDEVDMIIFGHTHNPFNEIIGGIRFFNPGSTSHNRGVSYNSYGTMDVQSKTEYSINIERL